MDKNFGHARKWLNPANDEDTGAISWSVVADGHNDIDAGISIWDCNKKITLNFDAWNDKRHIDRAKKINTIIEELIKFKDAMAKAYEYNQTQEQDLDEQDGLVFHTWSDDE